jgi:hypothetical protein
LALNGLHKKKSERGLHYHGARAVRRPFFVVVTISVCCKKRDKQRGQAKRNSREGQTERGKQREQAKRNSREGQTERGKQREQAKM